MATKKTRRDIVLTHWRDDTPEEVIRSAFRRKYSWVVDASRSPARWYATVLSNLACSYSYLESATMDAVRTALSNGLSRAAFERLKFITDLSNEQLSRVIRVPQRTLSRREKFKPDESDRILRVASVFQRAMEVLGSLDKARRWFVAPKRALGEKAPLEFCDTEPGAQEVAHLLGRIEHGVFT